MLRSHRRAHREQSKTTKSSYKELPQDQELGSLTQDQELGSLAQDQELENQSSFLRLPYDIRIIIYRMVLLSAHPFVNPHMLLLDNFDGTILPPGDINSSFIKTCRSVYQEASPTLYQNRFMFEETVGVVKFTVERMKRINNLRLVIGQEAPSYDRLPRLAQKAKLWCQWHQGVFQTRDSLQSWQKNTTASCFDNIRVLELDFSLWKLKKEEPFSPLLLKGIKESGWKLQKVRIVGLKNTLPLRRSSSNRL